MLFRSLARELEAGGVERAALHRRRPGRVLQLPVLLAAAAGEIDDVHGEESDLQHGAVGEVGRPGDVEARALGRLFDGELRLDLVLRLLLEAEDRRQKTENSRETREGRRQNHQEYLRFDLRVVHEIAQGGVVLLDGLLPVVGLGGRVGAEVGEPRQGARDADDALVAAARDELLVGEAQDGIARGPPELDRKSTRLNSSHIQKSRMPSSA